MASPFGHTVTFLHTADLDAASAFYHGILRLPFVPGGEHGLVEDLVGAGPEGSGCLVFAASPGALLALTTDDAPAPPLTMAPVLTLTTDDVESWARTLTLAGCSVDAVVSDTRGEGGGGGGGGESEFDRGVAEGLRIGGGRLPLRHQPPWPTRLSG